MQREHFLNSVEKMRILFFLVSLRIWKWLRPLRFYGIVFICVKFKKSRIWELHKKANETHKIVSYLTWMTNRAKIFCKPSFSLYSITLIVDYPFFLSCRRRLLAFWSQNITLPLLLCFCVVVMLIFAFTVHIHNDLPFKSTKYKFIDTFRFIQIVTVVGSLQPSHILS